MEIVKTEFEDLMEWTAEAGNLTMRSSAATNLFKDPGGEPETGNIPVAFLEAPDADFSMTVDVTTSLDHTYDAAGIFIRCGPDWSAKYVAERAPTGEVMAVSVITTDFSDDCNGPDLVAPYKLRVTRIGQSISWHIPNLDGTWRLARYSRLPKNLELEIGLLIQSPSGGGIEASFASVDLSLAVPSDLRNGS